MAIPSDQITGTVPTWYFVATFDIIVRFTIEDYYYHIVNRKFYREDSKTRRGVLVAWRA